MVRSVPLLERPRLVESLLDARVVLLVAPPGSGKTVLLDQWEQSLREKAHVVRVTMTFEHNDPLAFQAAIFPATAMALSADLANPDEVLPSSIPAFIDAVWNHPEPRRPTVFIFDQYECISETIISDAILSAFRMLPDDTVLVFSSRTAPNILVSDFTVAAKWWNWGRTIFASPATNSPCSPRKSHPIHGVGDRPHRARAWAGSRPRVSSCRVMSEDSASTSMKRSSPG